MIMTNLAIVLIVVSLVLWIIHPQFCGGLMSENDLSTVLRMIYTIFCELTLLLPPLSHSYSLFKLQSMREPERNVSLLMLCSFLLGISILV